MAFFEDMAAGLVTPDKVQEMYTIASANQTKTLDLLTKALNPQPTAPTPADTPSGTPAAVPTTGPPTTVATAAGLEAAPTTAPSVPGISPLHAPVAAGVLAGATVELPTDMAKDRERQKRPHESDEDGETITTMRNRFFKKSIAKMAAQEAANHLRRAVELSDETQRRDKMRLLVRDAIVCLRLASEPRNVDCDEIQFIRFLPSACTLMEDPHAKLNEELRTLLSNLVNSLGEAHAPMIKAGLQIGSERLKGLLSSNTLPTTPGLILEIPEDTALLLVEFSCAAVAFQTPTWKGTKASELTELLADPLFAEVVFDSYTAPYLKSLESRGYKAKRMLQSWEQKNKVGRISMGQGFLQFTTPHPPVPPTAMLRAPIVPPPPPPSGSSGGEDVARMATAQNPLWTDPAVYQGLPFLMCVTCARVGPNRLGCGQSGQCSRPDKTKDLNRVPLAKYAEGWQEKAYQPGASSTGSGSAVRFYPSTNARYHGKVAVVVDPARVLASERGRYASLFQGRIAPEHIAEVNRLITASVSPPSTTANLGQFVGGRAGF